MSFNDSYKMLVLTWLLPTVISFTISQDFLSISLEKMFKPPSKLPSTESSPIYAEERQSAEKLNVWWTSIPPFVSQSLSSSENQTSGTNAVSYEIDGIFPDILELAFNRCYIVHGKRKPVVIFKQLPVHNQSVLLEEIKRDEDFLLIPVQSDKKDKYKGFFTFLKLLESPGTVLIKRAEDSIFFRVHTWNTAILNCWPIITLTVSLSFVAGIAVWALEAKENSQEFRSPFCSGVFDGFWWAFVTMSTVGYGDKTPKSFISRLFSVIWIMTGITICSLLTATLSSAFTNEQVDYYGVLSGKKIGVVRNSIALQKAISLGAKTEVFEDLNEVHKALVSKSVDGMLEEIYIAMEFLETEENSSLSVAHFYEEKRGFGLAVTPDIVNELPWNCLKFVASIMEHNETVLMKHIHRSQIFNEEKDETSSKMTQETNKQNWPLFVKTVTCFSGITLMLLSFAVTRQCFRRRSLNRKREDIEMGQWRKISAQTSPWSWYERKLAVAVKHFFKEASILWKKLRKAKSNIMKPSLININSK